MAIVLPRGPQAVPKGTPPSPSRGTHDAQTLALDRQEAHKKAPDAPKKAPRSPQDATRRTTRI
eukprot:7199198-Pyramimonas_sp.AAC.1